MPITRPVTGTRPRETTLYLGEPAGFVIELENGYRIYHAGDTQPFGDMALIRELHRPDLAMLPIGGHFTMGPAGAARGHRAAGRQGRPAPPLRHVPDPGRDARPARASELAARGLGDVVVHSPDPGSPFGA